MNGTTQCCPTQIDVVQATTHWNFKVLRLQRKKKKTYTKFRPSNLELAGIDPAAYEMQTRRSTI